MSKVIFKDEPKVIFKDKPFVIRNLLLSGYIYEQWENFYLLPEKSVKNPTLLSRNPVLTIEKHFRELSQPIQIDYSDWETGEYINYKDVFFRYYISKEEITWEDAENQRIKQICGTLETEQKFEGYSEYTITYYWTNLFIGGRDIRKILRRHKGKYILMKIDYKAYQV